MFCSNHYTNIPKIMHANILVFVGFKYLLNIIY